MRVNLTLLRAASLPFRAGSRRERPAQVVDRLLQRMVLRHFVEEVELGLEDRKLLHLVETSPSSSSSRTAASSCRRRLRRQILKHSADGEPQLVERNRFSEERSLS